MWTPFLRNKNVNYLKQNLQATHTTAKHQGYFDPTLIYSHKSQIYVLKPFYWEPVRYKSLK